MGHEQRYKEHKRYLYALLFKSSGRAYIGQTVDPKRRHREHSKAWPEPFDFVQLDAISGTQAEASNFEYAWRYAAGQAGWTVIATSWDGSRPFVVDVRNRMNGQRWAIAGQCRWPRKWRRRSRWSWFFEWAAWQGAALAGMWFLLLQPV